LFCMRKFRVYEFVKGLSLKAKDSRTKKTMPTTTIAEFFRAAASRNGKAKYKTQMTQMYQK